METSEEQNRDNGVGVKKWFLTIFKKLKGKMNIHFENNYYYQDSNYLYSILLKNGPNHTKEV
jgi:hypothetical protein